MATTHKEKTAFDNPGAAGAQMGDKAGNQMKAAGQKVGEEAKRLGEKVGDQAQKWGDKLGEGAKQVGEKVGEQAENLASNVMHKAEDAASFLGHKADDATTSVGKGFESLGGAIREHTPKALSGAGDAIAETLEHSGQYLEQHNLKEMGEDVTNMIRRNPIPAVLIGIGVGFLLARAIRS